MTKVATAISVTSGPLSPQTKVSSGLAGPPVDGPRVPWDQVYKEQCSQIMQRFPQVNICKICDVYHICAILEGPPGNY